MPIQPAFSLMVAMVGIIYQPILTQFIRQRTVQKKVKNNIRQLVGHTRISAFGKYQINII